MSSDPNPPYGTGDTSFQAAGGVEGIRQLIDTFFDRMGSDARFATIYALHPEADVCRAEISTPRIAAYGQQRNFE